MVLLLAVGEVFWLKFSEEDFSSLDKHLTHQCSAKSSALGPQNGNNWVISVIVGADETPLHWASFHSSGEWSQHQTCLSSRNLSSWVVLLRARSWTQ